jgi:hypothetical protein
MGLIANLWFMHAFVATLLTAPAVFIARSRVNWRAWELLALVLPFCCWLALLVYGNSPKSLSNISEVFLLSFAIFIAGLVRVAMARRFPQTLVAAGLLLALCATATGIYFLTPLLPE